ncbi:unnamed protein product [Paramecium sonneborni]|uniref:Protein kintoun n=1 Tax=Paramecium sonneborni TaxID=65129 RepID=A0A8S1PGK9_9CILI|nr:unnamed protein product [Paramecium sonneborni]
MQIPNQHGTNPEDLKITRDEFKKIEKAMKRPEFAELMGDYMKEISDPKNREEYDQYLKQLEKESELPKGMKLIKPEPHFCVKTTIWNKQNRKHEQKFFINICSTGVLDKPQSETITQNGQTGQNWKIPYSIGKIRYDQDKKQNICNTVDVAFHPNTIGLCYKMPNFQNLVCSTALEASGKQLGERNEEISKDFKVLKHTKCKGGEPALLPVRIDKKGKLTNELDSRQGGQANAQTKLQKDINQMKEENEKTKEEEKLKQQQQKEELAEDDEDIKKESNEIESTAVSRPKFRFIYSYPVEYSDFLDSRANMSIKLPNQLACELKMFKVEAMKEIQLDLSNQALVLDVPNKYFLDIKLPYPIESNEASAKFDAKAKTLKIRAPISKEYLKIKYQEELDRIKQEQISIQNDDENQESEIKQEIQIKFIPQEPEDLKIDDQKVLVEELASSEIKDQLNQEIEVQEQKQENFLSLTFNQRQDGKLLFLIIRIKGYTKEELQIEYDENDLCILQKLIVNSIITNQFLHLKLQNNSDSLVTVDYVTDFVIIKFESKNQDNQIIIQEQEYANIPFSQFHEKLDELKNSRLRKLEQQQQKINNEELEIPYSKEQTQQPENQKKIEYIEQNNDEDDQPELKVESQQTLLNNFQQRKNIQFLRFHDIMPEIFEID